MARLLGLRFRLGRRDGWNRAQIGAYQAEALRKLRKFVYARSPFYRQFHRGLTDRPLEALPVLDKSRMMDAFDDLVTDRDLRRADIEAHAAGVRAGEPFAGRYQIMTSSGSSGRRGIFVLDRSEWAAVLAGFFMRSSAWAGLRLSPARRVRLAIVASRSPLHMTARAGASLRGRAVSVLQLGADEPSEATVARLNVEQPDMLAGYPSAIGLLAGEQRAGRLRIHPRVVTVSGEVLGSDVRARIEQVWGCRAFDLYGATECGVIAAECERHEHLHVYEDQVIVEVVDGDNRPVPAGAWGHKVLVTVLFRRLQPLIRYELTDSVRMATEPCSCGRPFARIEEIGGRAEGELRLPSIQGAGEVALHWVFFLRLFAALPVAEWQVVKREAGLLVVLAGAENADVERGVLDSLRRGLTELGAMAPSLRVTWMPVIPRGPGGKLPLVRVESASENQDVVACSR
jgi:putative adenylate-forming enzyme